ncbi:hypothetical protein PBOI14_30310 [Pseudomonas sp. Boi14]|nr:hypothetical protein PBOI14_30310 [Pseudomonas sp. Boi14]
MNTAQQVGIAPEFIILQTDHWVLNHHLSSALPGYLMLGSRSRVNSLAELPESALAELGGLLARVQKNLELQLKPKWLYISRFGHAPATPSISTLFRCTPGSRSCSGVISATGCLKLSPMRKTPCH